MTDTYATMRDIGAEFGLTSHQLGKILTTKGLREGGRPSGKAFHSDWVEQRYAPGTNHYIWAWDVEKTRTLLELAGYEKKSAI